MREVYVDQTDKYVSEVGEREYKTVGHPGEELAFTRFAPDEAYAEALSSKVIQCVDIIIVDTAKNKVLIGTRQQEPHAGDWVIGGAMRAGQSTTEAAILNMKRELGVEINQERLKHVGDYKYIWDTRAQPETLNEEEEVVTGCHMSATLLMYPVESGELSSNFNEEYDQLRWMSPFEIVDAEPGTYHPALVQMSYDMLEVITRPVGSIALKELEYV